MADGPGDTDPEELDPADPDQALFEEAMSGVRRLEQDRNAPEIVFRAPVPYSERERQVLQELDRLMEEDSPLPLSETGEYMEGAVQGLDPRVVRQLRRGEFTLQAELDLHGVVAETARGLVERFIEECHTRGLRCVRIVHGRGRNSPGGIPVLKTRLPRWLGRGPARQIVLAYTSALPHDGGAGAAYVLLRSSRSRRPRRDPL
jgi:DNA-nicking Smr family endonuclease